MICSSGAACNGLRRIPRPSRFYTPGVDKQVWEGVAWRYQNTGRPKRVKETGSVIIEGDGVAQ